MPSNSPKYTVCLTLSGCNAVVIDWTPEEAQLRANIMDKDQRDWSKSSVQIIGRVSRTKTSRVLAMEGEL